MIESLDDGRVLTEMRADTSSLFALHRFPVELELTLPSLDFESVRSFVWAEGLSLEGFADGEYAIQLASGTRLEWGFSELIETLITDLDLPRERFHPRSPKKILSVYFYQDQDRCRVWAGVSTPEQNLSCWSSGKCRIPRDPDAVSRAETKLLEAWEAFAMQEQVPSGRALDLGAAPGGWSRVLALKGYRVEAVDPAQLDPRVSALAAVTHHGETAGRFLARDPGPFALLVSDMKMDAVMAAELLLRHSGSLQPNGRLLTTLKLDRKSVV